MPLRGTTSAQPPYGEDENMRIGMVRGSDCHSRESPLSWGRARESSSSLQTVFSRETPMPLQGTTSAQPPCGEDENGLFSREIGWSVSPFVYVCR